MPSPALDRLLRPRGLAFVFGEYFLLVGIGAVAFAAQTAGRWYTAVEIRGFLAAFAGIAAAFLGMQLLLSVALERAFDRRLADVRRRLEALRAEAVREGADGASAETEAAVPDAEAFAELLDEIGSALEEMDRELTAPAVEVEPETAAREMEAARASRYRARARAETRLWLDAEQLIEDAAQLQAYVKGPALASGLVLGASLALLPAADGALLTFYPFATAFLAAGAFGTVGIVAYALTSYAGLLRSMRADHVRRAEVLDFAPIVG